MRDPARTIRALALALAASSAACSLTAPAPVPGLRFEPVTTAEFPDWQSNTAGRGVDMADEAASIADWRPGTELVYGLRTVIDDKTERWLLRFVEKTAPGPRQPINTPGFKFTRNGRPMTLEARSADVEMTMSAPSGKTKTKTVHRVFCEPFQLGLYASVANWDQPREELTEADRQMFAESFIGFFWVFMSISNEKTLREILFSVADRPSFLSVLLKLGIDMSFDLKTDQATPTAVTLSGHELPACRLPASVLVNGRPVLHSVFTIAAPRPPLQLGGGIISIEAYRPSDPEVHLVLSLLAGKR
ncbi:MAG: hypothetical protein VYE77_05560 [Planctomycetota bacterium]|nr:hypothetical protein [Planctomycetota bacterium]